MRIALFGGTFDPPHVGHLILGQALLNFLDIEKVFFVPAFIPPHKKGEHFSSVEDRLRMVELSIRSNDSFAVLEVEIKRGGISYSIDTIREVKNNFKLSRDNLFFAIGSDNLLDFDNWKSPDKILDTCRVVVFPRPGFDVNRVKDDYRKNVVFLRTPLIDISSREIREMVKRGQSIRYLVTDEVNRYINSRGLYK